MQKRVKMIFNQYVESAQVRRADGQWEIKYIPLKRQEVENADLYDIQYVDANGNRVDREKILSTFPQEAPSIVYSGRKNVMLVDEQGQPIRLQ